MNYRIPILSLIFLLFSVGAAYAQSKSDYEVQKSFKTQYKQYQQELETISAPDSAEALVDSIKQFDQEYQAHADLLNKALYPDTYDQKMEELKQSSVLTMNRLQKIQKQNTKMEELQIQLTSYEENLNELNQHADSLKTAMQKSIESEKRLSSMVRNYRRSLEKRDELILAFIDSMVVAYQKMDLDNLQDLENIDNKSRLKTDGNALKMIHEITQENLQILQQNSDKLRLQDYMRMGEVQDQFQKMWTSLGGKIKEIYSGENADQLTSEVDKNIDQWDQLLQDQTYATLNDSLQSNGIKVNKFSNSKELYSSLNNYLDQKIKQSKDEASEEGYQDFKRFQQFWNRSQFEWSSDLADAGLISQDQMASINQKVDLWARNAEPSSNNILVYLLGASVLLAVALGVMLIREKKSKR